MNCSTLMKRAKSQLNQIGLATVVVIYSVHPKVNKDNQILEIEAKIDNTTIKRIHH